MAEKIIIKVDNLINLIESSYKYNMNNNPEIYGKLIKLRDRIYDDIRDLDSYESESEPEPEIKKSDNIKSITEPEIKEVAMSAGIPDAKPWILPKDKKLNSGKIMCDICNKEYTTGNKTGHQRGKEHMGNYERFLKTKGIN